MDGHGEVVGMGIDMPILLPYISTSIVLMQFKFDNDKKHIMQKIIIVYGTHGRGIVPMSTKCHVCDMFCSITYFMLYYKFISAH